MSSEPGPEYSISLSEDQVRFLTTDLDRGLRTTIEWAEDALKQFGKDSSCYQTWAHAVSQRRDTFKQIVGHVWQSS